MGEGDKRRWEEEQRNLDRAWYDLDAGYDEYTNPFAQVSEEYVKKKEETLKQQKLKRKSARARQAQKVRMILLLRKRYLFEREREGEREGERENFQDKYI